MSTMLGASEGLMQELATRLTATTDEIAGVSDNTLGITGRVVEQMQESFSSAVGAIDGAMKELETSVGVTQGQVEGVEWVGVNRTTFNGAYDQFNTAMMSLSDSVSTAYVEFDAQIKAFSTTLEGFQAEVMKSLESAGASTTSMAAAVETQLANLVSAMNEGLRLG